MHLVDIALLAALALACFFVLRGMVRRRRQGGSCCGDCSACGTASRCRDRDKKT